MRVEPPRCSNPRALPKEGHRVGSTRAARPSTRSARHIYRERTERSDVNPTPSVVVVHGMGCWVGLDEFVGTRPWSRFLFWFGAWLSPVERCVRVAEVPGSNPGAPIDRPLGGRALLFGALAEWYCTRLESERPQGLGGSNPSRSVTRMGGCVPPAANSRSALKTP